MSFNFPFLIVTNGQKLDNCIDYSKIQTTKEGLYSTLMPIHAKQEIEALKNSIFKNPIKEPRVLDITGNVGCCIMTVATYFPDIQATVLEIDPVTYSVLCSNIEKLELTNITPLNIDCYEYVQNYNISDGKFTYIYCDPPWSSVEKYNKYKVYDDLFIMHISESSDESYISIFELIKMIFEKQLTNVVILKTPSKFNTIFKFGRQLKYIPIYNMHHKVDYRLYFITSDIMKHMLHI